jgi:hypothetical protein
MPESRRGGAGESYDAKDGLNVIKKREGRRCYDVKAP